MNTKKVTAIIIICILGIFLLYMLPTDVVTISNAVVNEETGDIAFAYADSSGRIDVIRVVVFNKEGEKLFSKSFEINGSHTDLCFSENKLYVSLARTDEFYCFEMDGSDSEPALTLDDVKAYNKFSGWEHSFGKYTYSYGDYLYCYNEPSVFSHYSSVTITYGNETKIIFESPVSE